MQGGVKFVQCYDLLGQPHCQNCDWLTLDNKLAPAPLFGGRPERKQKNNHPVLHVASDDFASGVLLFHQSWQPLHMFFTLKIESFLFTSNDFGFTFSKNCLDAMFVPFLISLLLPSPWACLNFPWWGKNLSQPDSYMADRRGRLRPLTPAPALMLQDCKISLLAIGILFVPFKKSFQFGKCCVLPSCHNYFVVYGVRYWDSPSARRRCHDNGAASIESHFDRICLVVLKQTGVA